MTNDEPRSPGAPSQAPSADAAALSEWTADLFAREDDVLSDLRAEMERRDMPAIAVSAEEGKLLQVLASAIGARRILEIGTLGGYSAIWMARALPRDGYLLTLELEEKHAEVARAFAARAGLDTVIEVRVGPALESLDGLERETTPPFDVCFIDADKESYPKYLDHAFRLVRPGGLILGDNAFLGGRILDPSDPTESAVAMREFNRRIAEDRRLISVVVPIRDGLSVSVVRVGWPDGNSASAPTSTSTSNSP